MSLPSVSIVLVNLNGRHHFEKLFESLRGADYPRELLEIIMVDNASVDGSVQWLDKNAPDARVIQCRQNHGFAGGVNVGVEAAQGEVLVFLNTDMREPRLLVRQDRYLLPPWRWQGRCRDWRWPAQEGKSAAWPSRRAQWG